MSEKRTFPTSAAERYDRALRRSLKLKPLPTHVTPPQPTSCWPEENIALLERYRDWLVGIGASNAVINHYRIPMAGHLLGLALKPHHHLQLTDDFDRAMRFVAARQSAASVQDNACHSLA